MGVSRQPKQQATKLVLAQGWHAVFSVINQCSMLCCCADIFMLCDTDFVTYTNEIDLHDLRIPNP